MTTLQSPCVDAKADCLESVFMLSSKSHIF
jgi:hypothetical protein